MSPDAIRASDEAYSSGIVYGIRSILAAPSPLSLDALCLLGEWTWAPCPPAPDLRARQRAARRDAVERIFEEHTNGNEYASMVAYSLLAADEMEGDWDA